MDKKFMSKLLLGMMVFVILNLFEMHATDHGSSSFHPFSASIPLSHFSKLDIVHHSIHACIKNEFMKCMHALEKMKNQSHIHEVFITRSFRHCVLNYEYNPDLDVVIRCLAKCKNKESEGVVHRLCLEECYTMLVGKHHYI